MKKYTKRELVSFNGKCNFNCKHCFALELEDNQRTNSISQIINSLKSKEFDVIYVSHNKENFINVDEGIELCETLFNTYKKDICVTTRQVIEEQNALKTLKDLNNKMLNSGNSLYFSISIPALYSYDFTENKTFVPTPIQRILFMKSLKNMGIKVILTVRPLFPEKYIEKQEIIDLIRISQPFVDAVTTGGLIATDEILKRLSINKNDIDLSVNNDSDYLVGAVKENAMFVNVNKEIEYLKEICQKNNLQFFKHSMDALNYLYKNSEWNK
ncbi:MAG: hypothetical protein NC213_07645 [Acetobacter sp.]|nr:hypothetical protein [Bacteroides sp.]MCM1341603.1 hypothetical protein [Acetobacter sp.]MCM1434076.1 hypothetical protein [Clostridiales bacterium]